MQSDGSLPLIALDEASFLEYTRGKRWHKYLCMGSTIVSICLVYFVVFYSSRHAGSSVPAERALTASLGLSVCVVLFIAVEKLLIGHLWSICFQFSLRGASVSILFAMIFEIASQLAIQSNLPMDSSVSLFLMMVSVGFIEEAGKFSVLLYRTCFSAAILPRHMNSLCCSLVTNSRMFVALGIAVGFGFMISENISYFIQVDVMSPDDDSASRILTGFIRTFMNLHPLLTGIASLRLAERMYVKERMGLKRTSHIVDWLHALWLPAVLHGSFDFMVMMLQGSESVVGVVVILLVWWIGCLLLLGNKFRRLSLIECVVEENGGYHIQRVE